MIRKTRAPYRILDCGGWTDTSFMPGGKGACCNVAISLYVHADYEPDGKDKLRIIHAANGQTELIPLPFSQGKTPKTLAEATTLALNLSAGQGGNVRIYSDVPPGSGVGGSASYGVAFLAALEPKLLKDRHALAALAQELETKWLGNSCGTQDQMAASYGGISYSDITYPAFTHEPVQPSSRFQQQLEDELILVYTGESHFSSAMHHTVIVELEKGVDRVIKAFSSLKQCGESAAKAIRNENFSEYKQIINMNWQAQKDLHEGITTPAIESLHRTVKLIDKMAGFKGSGAGGGGSVAILVLPDKKRDVISVIQEEFPSMKIWDSLTVDIEGAKQKEEN